MNLTSADRAFDLFWSTDIDELAQALNVEDVVAVARELANR